MVGKKGASCCVGVEANGVPAPWKKMNARLDAAVRWLIIFGFHPFLACPIPSCAPPNEGERTGTLSALRLLLIDLATLWSLDHSFPSIEAHPLDFQQGNCARLLPPDKEQVILNSGRPCCSVANQIRLLIHACPGSALQNGHRV